MTRKQRIHDPAKPRPKICKVHGELKPTDLTTYKSNGNIYRRCLHCHRETVKSCSRRFREKNKDYYEKYRKDYNLPSRKLSFMITCGFYMLELLQQNGIKDIGELPS